MESVEAKDSLTLLKLINQAVEKYGIPKRIRTDNEPILKSSIFKKRIKELTGKLPRYIQKNKPWQNGRIERFWGTLKERLKKWGVDSFDQLKNSLEQFEFWYINVRPHQHLNGKTPDEVWNKEDVFANGYKKI